MKTKTVKREKESVSLQGVQKEIRRAVDTGKVSFGKRESEKRVLKGEAELIIVSRNTPKTVAERMRQLSDVTGTPVLEFQGTGLELGSVCGKPFIVSVMAVQNSGKSRILSVAK